MKVNKPKAHKQASHCGKRIPDVISHNYHVVSCRNQATKILGPNLPDRHQVRVKLIDAWERST